MLCFALILTSSWFLMQYLALQGASLDLSAVVAGQLIILIPPLMMAVLLTSSPRRTLAARLARAAVHLSWPSRWSLALNPLVNELRPLVEWLFPISSIDQERRSRKLMAQVAEPGGHDRRLRPGPGRLRGVRVPRLHPLRPGAPAPHPLGDLAVGPDVRLPPRPALSLFQQLFNATLLGIVLGLLAVRSRSILPGIVFHFLNNAMAVAQGYLREGRRGPQSIVPWIYRNPDDGLYHVRLDRLASAAALGVLAVLPVEAEVRAYRPAWPSSGAEPVEPAV